MRLRVADGFSHARSLAYATALTFVQAIIALIGLAGRDRQRRIQPASSSARCRPPFPARAGTC